MQVAQIMLMILIGKITAASIPKNYLIVSLFPSVGLVEENLVESELFKIYQ